MNRTISNAVIFLLGAAAGAIVTRYLLQEEYEHRIDEETAELKDLYSQKARCEEKIAELDKQKADESAAAHYAKRVQNEGYAAHSDQRTTDKPYIITPDEFGELDDYNTVTLFWYANDILADEDDEIVDDIPEIIGDALTHFGDEDSLYVRNDAKRCDYEVLISLKDFTDIS